MDMGGHGPPDNGVFNRLGVKKKIVITGGIAKNEGVVNAWRLVRKMSLK